MILARSSAGRQKAGLRRELASRRESSGCRARSRILPKPKDTCWPIDTHTRAKHQILREYLQAWLPIVGTKFPRIRLIDGFAGPGCYVGGEPGSPIIMLNTLLEHSARASISAKIEYIFIEERQDRFEALERSIEALRGANPLPSSVTVDSRSGRFDQLMPLVAPASEAHKPPTFAFVDPFGWKDAPMELTSGILGIDHCEALIYVPLPFIARFVDEASVEDSLTLLYGGETWRNARTLSADARIEALRTSFEMAMLEHSTYVRAFDIRPDGNRGYTLFFGTRSLLGLEKMKAVMWNVDPAGGCLYTDMTDPGQEVLFKPEPDYSQLESMLRQHFHTKAFSIEEAEQFVLDGTPFAKSHLKTRTLKPAEVAGHLTAIGRARGRKRGTFPPGTRLRFQT